VEIADELKAESTLAQACDFRKNKYLNNIVEQDYCFIKKLVNPSLGFKSFHTARRTIIGYEAISMIRKGQVKGVIKTNIIGQVKFIAVILELLHKQS
jgi:transposase-like protein